MTVMASSGQSGLSLAAVADATTSRTWATKEEIYEVFLRDCEQREVRPHTQLFENVWAVYNALRKREAIGGDGTTSTRQLARDLYPDVGEDIAAWQRKRVSIWRWLKLLERQGLIQTSELRGGSGKSLGLRVELLTVTEEVMALARGCSSAGSSDRIRVPHRPLRTAEERCEARVRPWCPRAGRGSPGRFESPVPLFSPEKVETPGGQEGKAPKGALPSCPTERRAACARGAPDAGSVDTIEPDGEQSEVAALERRLTAALGEGAAQALWRAELAFAAIFGEPPKGRLRHLPTIRELLWVLQRLDRYGDFGRGRPGAGEAALEGALEAQAYSVRWEGAALPAHLGYFIPALRAEARRWKHTWAPRIKAQRVAAGVRRPSAREPVEERTPRPALERSVSKHLSSARDPGGVGMQRRLAEYYRRGSA